MLSLKKKALACTIMGASLLALGTVGQAAAASSTQTPGQNEHHTGFTNMDRCDPAKDTKRHPWEQWITDEQDRYSGINSFTNRTDRLIQCTLEVTEGVNESAKAMSSGNMWDVFLYGMRNKYGIVEVNQRSVGDELSPVTVSPGEIVRADYDVYMRSFIGRARTCDQRTGL